MESLRERKESRKQRNELGLKGEGEREGGSEGMGVGNVSMNDRRSGVEDQQARVGIKLDLEATRRRQRMEARRTVAAVVVRW
jgi:hypothetical protein